MNSLTYADVFRPCRKELAVLYDTVLIVAGSLIIALCAQLAVSIGPIPFTFQTFAVLMIAAMLGSRRAVLSVIVYIAQGVAGLPVFAMGRPGPAVLISPTGGYIIGFIAAAFIVGFLADRGWDKRPWTTILAMLLGSVALYTFGLSWLGLQIGWQKALTFGLYPFLVGDALKIFLAAVLLPAGWKFLDFITNES
ncbi:MAG: biotin transporter BioY [Planctomycetota bacterium]